MCILLNAGLKKKLQENSFTSCLPIAFKYIFPRKLLTDIQFLNKGTVTVNICFG
jgi:hypothetical protein